MRAALSMTCLEARDTPASFLAPGGQLTVSVSAAPGPHTVDLSTVPAAAGTAVQVTEDGQVSGLFPTSMVTSLFVQGSNAGRNVIQNNTAVLGVLVGGSGNDSLFGGTGTNVLLPGGGDDEVYALLGVNVISTGGDGTDAVLTNAGASVLAGAEDQVVRFFGPGRTPGTPFVGLDPSLNDGVLYITPSNGGSDTRLAPGANPGDVTATLDLGDGLGSRTRAFSGVKFVSFFGGSGRDVYVNATTVPDAAYGSGGDDFLAGSLGAFSLLKGSGGNDVLLGRSRSNDLSGNSGADTLVATAGVGGNTFRVDAQDAVIGFLPAAGDITISP